MSTEKKEETLELTQEDLKEMIKGTVEEVEKESKVDERLGKIEKMVEAKKVDNEEEELEEVKVFLKALATDDKEKLNNFEKKAVSTDEASFGYTVPTALAKSVLEKKDKIAKIRPLATVFSMSGTFQLPIEGTAVTAYHVGENEEVDESNPTVGKKTLNDYYMAARVLMPYKLLDTSSINIVNYVSNLAGRALNMQEETDFVAGDGDNKATGLRQESVETVYLDGANLAYDDLVDLFYAVKEQYRKGNCAFLTSTEGIKILKTIKDEYGRPIFDVRDDTLFGKPVLESEDIPSNLGTSGNETEIWFGDFSYYWIKDGVKMVAESDKVISKMQVEIVLHEAVDGKLVLPEAFAKLAGVK